MSPFVAHHEIEYTNIHVSSFFACTTRHKKAHIFSFTVRERELRNTDMYNQSYCCVAVQFCSAVLQCRCRILAELVS